KPPQVREKEDRNTLFLGRNAFTTGRMLHIPFLSAVLPQLGNPRPRPCLRFPGLGLLFSRVLFCYPPLGTGNPPDQPRERH
ncbi:MAG TPA: hypothetical protein PKK20_02255, partial [Verrucomicrobiota bacterium]|nr:hypothetical protein [Verrucomicrobiota bacterium]